MTNLKHSLLITLQGPGPMAEIELWEGRASVLSALCKQLEQPVVKKIVEVLTISDAAIVHTLNNTIAELSKYHLESDDISLALKTLERHFMVSNL